MLSNTGRPTCAFPQATIKLSRSNGDWPINGWVDDVRPKLAKALRAGRAVVLATLTRTIGSAPREAGTQMLFDGETNIGYFTGGCVEGDVALHADEVLSDGKPRRLLYGKGSPWIDIQLQCGGAIEILVERILPDSIAAHRLIEFAEFRRPAIWRSDGERAVASYAAAHPQFVWQDEKGIYEKRFDPRMRLVISGWDPSALAIAKLAADSGFETFVVRPYGPDEGPDLDGVAYLRSEPVKVLESLGADPWTCFIGATHDSDWDLPAAAFALKQGCRYVGQLGAASRRQSRIRALQDLGVDERGLDRFRSPIGNRSLGRSPWAIAIGVVAEMMVACRSEAESAVETESNVKSKILR